MQTNNYYPFGLESFNNTASSPKNYYLYNKKELQENIGLYDYGARFYDPIIARWQVVDPLAEKSRRFSSYVYGNDNPVRFIDPDGMSAMETAEIASILAQAQNQTGDDPKKPRTKTGTRQLSTKPDATSRASNIPAKQPKLSDDLAHFNVTSERASLTAWPPPEPVNYQDLGNRNTSLATSVNVVNAVGMISGVSEMSGAIRAWSAARSVESVSGTLDGSFSVSNWSGYPTVGGGLKPSGPFQLLEGADYQAARTLANQTNAALREVNPELLKGYQIHEIQPVKFGGSPTGLSNKILLTPAEHAQYTNYWNAMMRSINKP